MELFSIISHLIIQAKENPEQKRRILFSALEELKEAGLDIKIEKKNNKDKFSLYWLGKKKDFVDNKDKIKRSIDFFFDVFIDKSFILKDIKLTEDRRILCFNEHHKECLE